MNHVNKRIQSSLLFSCFVGLCICANHLAAQNLLVNGDFRAGNTGFQSGYTYSTWNAVGGGEYTVTANPRSWNPSLASPPTWFDHTSTTDNVSLLVNGSPNAGVDFWRETVAVQRDTQYQFTGWAAELFAGRTGSPGRLQICVNAVATGSAFQISDPASSTPDWRVFSASFNSGDATSVMVSIRDLNLSWELNDFAVDDLSLVAVPEPSAACLLALASLCGLMHRARDVNRGSDSP